MPEQPLVSIISVYYNRKNFVSASVQSLLNQSCPELEIILVDDGSTDGTLQALQSFSNPRVRVITGTNQGFVKALKGAIETAHGSLIAIHGSGDVSQPQRVEKQVEFLLGHPEVGVVGCYVSHAAKKQKSFHPR
jgi:glycosyltransferase involved in cell wall biosynthesis